MRKVLLLSLMLCITSLSSAAFELIGPTQVTPGNTVTIDFVGDAGATGIYYIVIPEDDPGIFTNAEINSNADYWAQVIIDPPFPRKYVEIVVVDPTGNDGIPAGVWATMTFLCQGLGNVTIEVYEDASGYNQDDIITSLTIEQIPEPTSFALMGLGGISILNSLRKNAPYISD